MGVIGMIGKYEVTSVIAESFRSIRTYRTIIRAALLAETFSGIRNHLPVSCRDLPLEFHAFKSRDLI